MCLIFIWLLILYSSLTYLNLILNDHLFLPTGEPENLF